MKTILVPIDFSENASKALTYALFLARHLNGQIFLYYNYPEPDFAEEQTAAMRLNELVLLREEAEKKLISLINSTPHSDAVSLCFAVEAGQSPDCILDFAKTKKVDMIILGSAAPMGTDKAICDPRHIAIMEKASCPVMSIPADFDPEKPIKNITFATDYQNSDIAAILHSIEIATITKAKLTVLHVCDAIIGYDEEEALMQDFLEKVKEKTRYTNLSFLVVHGYNVEERLEHYLEEGAADMLIMATHYRTFFDQLFDQPATGKIAQRASIPLLAFHCQAKTAVKFY